MPHGYPWYSLAIVPIVRNELPGWGKLARAMGILGAEMDARWRGAPRKSVRGKWHRFWMELDLSDWSQRQTWFLARYHDLELQLLMSHCLRRGDRMVDVGANIGMLTLHAASLVGPTGLVEAFEPNPDCCRQIDAALRRNRIEHVRLHRIGLSDAPATLTLKILLHHSGMGTLATMSEEDAAAVTSSVEVPVEVGDAVLLKDDRPITLIKVDVEGFEPRALRGMSQTLNRFKPLVTTEVIESWLQRAGSSINELFQLMRGFGYRGYGLATERRGLRYQLRAKPLPPGDILPAGVSDVLWAPQAGDWADRLRGIISA